MVTLRSWPDDGPDNDGDKSRTVMLGAVVAAVVLVALMGVGMAVVDVASDPNRRPPFDPSQTVTYRGQVFAHFQPELNAGGIAERVRGTPLQVDQLWNLIQPRDEITINGVVYGDCEGHGPIVQAHLTYPELVCHRRPAT